MMRKGNEMVTNLCGGSFELKSGRKWTHGISPFREREALNLRWEKVGAIGGRHFFEIIGVQYSAKSISPRIEGIQMHSENKF
jgi:hypothetical protein